MVTMKIKAPLVDDRKNLVWHYEKLIESSKNKEIKVFTSSITINEALFVREGDKKILTPEVKRLFRAILESGDSGVFLIESDFFIRVLARDLHWEHKIPLKANDGLHLASAIEFKCDEFITTNSRDFFTYRDVIKKNLL